MYLGIEWVFEGCRARGASLAPEAGLGKSAQGLGDRGKAIGIAFRGVLNDDAEVSTGLNRVHSEPDKRRRCC